MTTTILPYGTFVAVVMPAILPYGTFVAVRPLMNWWPWVPARVIGLEIDSFGCPWYCVEYAAHAGSYQHMFNEHYVVKVEFEPKE